MKIHADLKVKFRAFGITFGTVEQHFNAPLPIQLPVQVPIPTTHLISFHQRGIDLDIYLQPL